MKIVLGTLLVVGTLVGLIVLFPMITLALEPLVAALITLVIVVIVKVITMPKKSATEILAERYLKNKR